MLKSPLLNYYYEYFDASHYVLSFVQKDEKFYIYRMSFNKFAFKVDMHLPYSKQAILIESISKRLLC